MLLLGGCSEDPTGPSDTSETTYFDIGSYWIYDVISYDTNGVVISAVEDSIWITKVDTASSKLTITYSTGASYIYDTLGLKNASTGSYWYFSNPDKGDTCWERKRIPIKVDSSYIVLGDILRSVIEVDLPTATVAGPFKVDEYMTVVMDTSNSLSLSQDYEFYDYSIGLVERHYYGKKSILGKYFFQERRELKRYHIEHIATLFR